MKKPPLRVTPFELCLRSGDIVATINRNGTMWVDWTHIDPIAAPDDLTDVGIDPFEVMVWMLRRLRGVVPEVTRDEAERIAMAGP